MKIVAPAGNMERFYAAVKAGAQEIYMGLKGFGARRNAENFTLEEYKEAIDYAHKRGVKYFNIEYNYDGEGDGVSIS